MELGFLWSRSLLLFLGVCKVISKGTSLGSKRSVIATKKKQNNKEVQGVIGEGNGTPLQYSCMENPMDGGAW